MKSSHNQNSKEGGKQESMISGLVIGVTLGIVFWSALEDLLPFPFDLLMGVGSGLLIGYRLGKQPPAMLMRYPPGVLSRLLIAGAAFVLGLWGYSYLLDLGLTNTQRVLSSIVAILPAVVFVVMLALAIGHLDEMQRRIQTEGIAIGYAGTALVISVYALLGMADVPAPTPGLLLLVMVFMWLIGKLWTMWRYK